MAAIERYIPLTQVVTYFIDEAGLTQAEFRRLWTLAFRGLVNMGFNTMWQAKTVKLPVAGNLTANLPSDYLSWVKVGVFGDNGVISVLSVNNNLSNYKSLSPNRLTNIEAQEPDPLDIVVSPYFYNFYNDGSYTHLFGVGGGLMTPGECKVDEQNGVILFDPNFSFSEVVLEYLSSPEQDDDYTIDVRCQEALISWLRWKDVQSSKSVSATEKRDRRRAYYDDLVLCKKYLKPMRLQEIEEAVRQNSNLKLKA